jgi:hypothetical protein
MPSEVLKIPAVGKNATVMTSRIFGLTEMAATQAAMQVATAMRNIQGSAAWRIMSHVLNSQLQTPDCFSRAAIE